MDEPIAIRQLKRHAADADLAAHEAYVPEKKPAKHRKIAVVGSGPGGLTAGYYLSNEGYDVTVFESMPKQAVGYATAFLNIAYPKTF